MGLFRSKRCELYGRGIGRKEVYELTQEGSLCYLCAKKMQVGTKVACLNVFIGRLIFFFSPTKFSPKKISKLVTVVLHLGMSFLYLAFVADNSQ